MYRKKQLSIIALILVISFITAGCRNGGKNKNSDISSARDSSLIEPPVINNLFLDSASVASFLSSHPEFKDQSEQVWKFYKKRDYQFAWFNNEGMIEQAGHLMNMVTQYRSEGIIDSTVEHNRLPQQLYDSIAFGQYSFKGEDSMSRETELRLTAGFFSYAEKIWGGIPEEQSKQADWYIKRKRLPYEAILDSIISNQEYFTQGEPVYRQYELLKAYLQKYRDIENKESWTPIVADKKSYGSGDSSVIISTIRKRLFVTGDLAKPDTSGNIFDRELENAVKNFQHRYGLPEDGIIGSWMLNELNTPLSKRIEQIIINMERSRWVPVQLKGDYLAVNIPDYKLHVYENDSLMWSCNVVVGTTMNKTVIFNDEMNNIVFSPYWNITPTITANEILPAVKRNRGYLASHNMEVVGGGKVINPSTIDWNKYSGRNFPYMIRQKPGPNNSLGRVKFLFPNNYNIYLHDTPAKSLFNEPKRAFSHGCIRVGEPKRLAEYLLRNDSSWNSDKIANAMNSGKETYVTLATPVPVFIAYFTAWVDRQGKLNFRDDIYGHDAKLAKELFVKPAM